MRSVENADDGGELVATLDLDRKIAKRVDHGALSLWKIQPDLGNAVERAPQCDDVR